MTERFDAYMERCLYDPDTGFYSSGLGSAGGARGDFITSPEVGPLFGEVIGAALDGWWEQIGRPEDYHIFDVGSGPGTLARVLSSVDGPSAASRRVHTLDRAGESGRPGVGESDLAGLPTSLANTVVIANELLDNLPFRVLERIPDGWAEVHVVETGGRLIEELLPAPDDALRLLPGLISREGSALPIGARVPLLERAAAWVHEVLERDPAVLLTFDYGMMSSAELAARGGWLRTYRRHERGHDPLHEPGRWDITTDIAVDQLPMPAETVVQTEFLRRWGIDELVSRGRDYWNRHAAAPDVAALRMRSRIAEAQALTDPAGLGGWLVCRWGPA